MKFLNEEDQRLYENLVRELPNKTLQELAKIGFYADFCTKVYNSIPNAGRRSGVPDSRLPRRRTARILWSMLGNSLTDRSIIHTETVLKGKDISLELYSSDDNTEALRSFKVRAGLVDPDVNHDVETYPGLSYKKESTFGCNPPNQELNMTPYEVKEFVFGQEADKISIDQLLNAVTKTDERIGALKQLAEESTKVCEMVKELVDQRASIIALIDER